MWWTAFFSATATLLVIAAVALIAIYSGAFNVSAAAGHSGIGRWALQAMMRNSVQTRADTEQPAITPAMIKAGASEYKAMCQQCLGGPGADRASWSKGIVPQPPDLARAATKWSPAEVHWIVDNGIKMTAMPGFGSTHDQQTIWNIAAFVQQLPSMSPEEYEAFPTEGHGSSAESSHSH